MKTLNGFVSIAHRFSHVISCGRLDFGGRSSSIKQIPFVVLLAAVLVATFSNSSLQAAGNLAVRQDAFLSPGLREGVNKNPNFVSGYYKSDRNSQGQSVDTLSAQLNAQISPSNSYLSYINIQELYWQQDTLTVGRRLINWSEFDSSFNLGFYQPIFDWNQTRAQTQGLSGLFVEIRPQTSVPWGFTLFASKFFLPNQGTNYEVRDGKFENSNPYFKGPATSIQFSGQSDPLVYTLEKPEASEVIFQNSFASRIFLGDESNGYYLQAAFAEKPSNKLALGIDGENQSAAFWNGRVKPTVYMHRLISADAKYSFDKVQVGTGALREIPRDPNYTSDWTYFKYQNTTMVGVFIQTLRLANFHARLEYLNVQGGQESSTGGKLAPYVTELNGNRVPFEGAFQASADWNIKLPARQRLNLRTSLLQEEKGRFANWITGVDYQFQKFWTLNADVQLLAASEELSQKNMYFANRSNDSASVGVSYVF